MAVKKAVSNTSQVAVTIPPLNIQSMTITLIGDSPLVVHNWSEKAKEEIRIKQGHLAKPARAAKDPQQCYEDSLYPLGKGYGFPAIAFKCAAVDACSCIAGITKVEAESGITDFPLFTEPPSLPGWRHGTVPRNDLFAGALPQRRR
jgi:hypothetical protein